MAPTLRAGRVVSGEPDTGVISIGADVAANESNRAAMS